MRLGMGWRGGRRQRRRGGQRAATVGQRQQRASRPVRGARGARPRVRLACSPCASRSPGGCTRRHLRRPTARRQRRRAPALSPVCRAPRSVCVPRAARTRWRRRQPPRDALHDCERLERRLEGKEGGCASERRQRRRRAALTPPAAEPSAVTHPRTRPPSPARTSDRSAADAPVNETADAGSRRSTISRMESLSRESSVVGGGSGGDHRLTTFG